MDTFPCRLPKEGIVAIFFGSRHCKICQKLLGKIPKYAEGYERENIHIFYCDLVDKFYLKKQFEIQDIPAIAIFFGNNVSAAKVIQPASTWTLKNISHLAQRIKDKQGPVLNLEYFGGETMDKNYQKALEYALPHIKALEGGYVYDSQDPGGETKYGISKKQYPNISIKELTYQDAVEIYERDYFKKIYDPRRGYRLNAYLFEGSLLHPSIIKNAIGKLPVAEEDSAEEYLQILEIYKARLLHYRNMVRVNPALLKYLYGWSVRGLWILELYGTEAQ